MMVEGGSGEPDGRERKRLGSFDLVPRRASKDGLRVSVREGRWISSDVLLAPSFRKNVDRMGERLESRDPRANVGALEGEGGVEREIIGGELGSPFTVLSPSVREGELPPPNMLRNKVDGRPFPMFPVDFVGLKSFDPVD